MDDARGVQVGMIVRDAAGNTLGKVRRVYPWGFEAGKGFWSPYQWVFRTEEVLRVGSGAVDVARGPDDLLRLANGELPSSWRRGTPAPEGGSALPPDRKPR
jgi:hypothetical protein